MKRIISFFVICFGLMQILVYGQSASATYPLTSATTTSVNVSGNISANIEKFSELTINNYSGPNSSQRVTTLNGGWPGETQQKNERYIQFAVSPTAGNNFTVTSVTLELGAAGGGNMRANIRVSTDSTFTTSTLLNSAPLALPSGAFLSPSPNYSLNQTAFDGETLYLRIYPWYTSAASGKYICPQNLIISGTTTAASLINLSVPSLPSLGLIVAGTSSGSESYTVSGAGLTGDITLTSPPDFEISSDNTNFSGSLVLLNSGGLVSPTTIYARFSPVTPTGAVTGRIIHSSPNAGVKYVNLQGISIATEPTTQSSISFGTVTGHSIEVSFSGGNGGLRTLVVRPGNPVSWSPADGEIIFGVSNNYMDAEDKGGGNKVVYRGNGTNATVNGLLSNVLYHFAVYEYNEGTGNSQNYLTTNPGTGSHSTLAVPTIIVNPETLEFGSIGVGLISAEKTYSITAGTLSPSTGNLSITAPVGYEVSLTSGTGFAQTINIPYSGGGLAGTNVFVRFKPTALTSYQGALTNTGGSAPQVDLMVTGKGMVPNSQQNADIIVSKDGTGDFLSIQEAINSIPANNTVMKVILIKNGFYNEKIYISNSNITLVGEDRENTEIVFAELRSNWVGTSGGSDWGAATLNIGNNVTNIVVANLTIYNNYGTLYGSTDHQFAIRGASADKIIIINCNIKADGGDTVSLWNVSAGKYYHYNCYFEGYVDFVCPRGWCYIADSRFYQRSSSASASIWHDGSSNQNSKFVIRHSRFEGVPNFALGRHHLDAQFYLLDNTFSFNMKDQPIFQAVSNPPVTLQWGGRYYYFNNHRDSIEYNWYADNLDSAQGSPNAADIDAEWTYSTAPSQWNPEANFPQVLPNAEFPEPRRNKIDFPTQGVSLKWVPGRRSQSHNVYFGTTNPPPFIGNQTGNTYNPGELQDSVEYFWRIDEVSPYDTIRGEVWSFFTDSGSVVGTRESGALPGDYELQQNYPNPFNPDTNIKYSIKNRETVTLKVYDIIGREIKTLVNEQKEPGNYTANFSTRGNDIASGIYFYQLIAGEFMQTKKMNLIK